MSNGTMRPPRPAAQPVNEPLKHVIAEYKHQAQTITCVCGWHGRIPDQAPLTSGAADAASIHRPDRRDPRRSFDSRINGQATTGLRRAPAASRGRAGGPG